MNISQLQIICPTIGDRAETWLDGLNNAMEAAEINTIKRQAAFIAQCAHESGEFLHLIENLNYSAAALLAVFPRYFSAVEALNYARNPERIANKVYANRMGNGDEASGDGWKHRGVGIFQHTGKDNHWLLSTTIFGDDRLVLNPALIMQPELSCKCACVYWDINKLNALADTSFDAVCDVVNIGRKTATVGDSNGWSDRFKYYQRGLAVLTGD